MKKGRYCYQPLLSLGAEGESRTPTPLPELDPEPSVSTNSTTSARKCVYRIRPLLASFFFRFSPFFMGAHKSTMFWKVPAGRPGTDADPPAAWPWQSLRHRAGAAFSGDAMRARDGRQRARADGPSLPLRRQPFFRRLAVRPKPEKQQGSPMRRTAPPTSRPAFFPLPRVRHGQGHGCLRSLSRTRQARARPLFRPASPPMTAARAPLPSARTGAWR